MARRHGLVMLLAVMVLWAGARPVRATDGASSGAVDGTWGTGMADNGKAGRVMALAASNGVVYLGGDFTTVSPPGAADGSAGVVRHHLAAFANGGTALAGWNPDADDEVQALLPSADGRRIYAGGMFHHIGNGPAIRLAALDAVTGAPDPAFTPPRPNGVVRALALSPDGKILYVGGDFDGLVTGDGTVVERPHIAALDAASGTLTDWVPPKDTGGRYHGQTGTPDRTRSGGVYAIAPSADGTTVHVGGTFLSWAGHAGLVSLDAATGRPTPWQAKVDRPIWGLSRSRDGHTFYAAAGGTGGRLYAFRPHGPPAGVWQVKTDGDVVAVLETATGVYVAGHYDNIVRPDSGCWQYCPDGMAREHLSAFDRTGRIEDWNPGANTPTGPYAVAADAGHLYVGGEFTKIGGVRHPGFAAFAGET